MRDPAAEVITRPGDGITEVMTVRSPETRDHIILIREVCNALRTGAAREIEMVLGTKEWNLTIKAKR